MRQCKENPLLGGERLGTCFDVNVVRDGPAPWTMYFSWRPRKAIALVRSEDGFTWSQEPEICLESDPSSGWEDNINRSCTVFRDGLWHMWYTGQADGKSKIGYATSRDGVLFERVRREPVMVPERDWEKCSVMNPYVRWDAARGLWRMWYAAGETYEPNAIGYAESTDGVEWKKSRINPIFCAGKEPYDSARVGGCEVLKQPDGSYIMFYIGYEDIHTARICAATSPDGIRQWTRLASNPIVSPERDSWDGDACYKPSVVFEPDNSRWRLWYNGRLQRAEYVGMAEHPGVVLE